MKSIAEYNTIVDDATGEDLLMYERETTTNAPLKKIFLSSDTGGPFQNTTPFLTPFHYFLSPILQQGNNSFQNGNLHIP
jgi:hypothetical protein